MVNQLKRVSNIPFIEPFELEATSVILRNIEFIVSCNPKFKVDLAWVDSGAQVMLSAPNLPSSLSCAHHYIGFLWWQDGDGSSCQGEHVSLSNPNKRLTTLHRLRLGMRSPLYGFEGRVPCSTVALPDYELRIALECSSILLQKSTPAVMIEARTLCCLRESITSCSPCNPAPTPTATHTYTAPSCFPAHRRHC